MLRTLLPLQSQWDELQNLNPSQLDMRTVTLVQQWVEACDYSEEDAQNDADGTQSRRAKKVATFQSRVFVTFLCCRRT
jgi:hypothetical protein